MSRAHTAPLPNHREVTAGVLRSISKQMAPTLPDGTIDRVRQAQAAMARADAELRAASEEIRVATRVMLATGMSQQDAAVILGVSRQRVAQLLHA